MQPKKIIIPQMNSGLILFQDDAVRLLRLMTQPMAATRVDDELADRVPATASEAREWRQINRRFDLQDFQKRSTKS